MEGPQLENFGLIDPFKSLCDVSPTSSYQMPRYLAPTNKLGIEIQSMGFHECYNQSYSQNDERWDFRACLNWIGMPRRGKKKMDKISCEFKSNSAADKICSDLKTFFVG